MNGALLTPDQVAERLAVPVSTVWLMIRRHDLAAHNIGTRLRPIYRISEAQLDEFLTARLATTA